MPNITYICIFNNKNQVDNLLMPSMHLLREKCRDFNFFLIDSKLKGYKSAAEAFNKTLDQQWDNLGEIVCFIHQDVRFDDTAFHDRLCRDFDRDHYQIIGSAGINDKCQVLSNLEYWRTKQKITHNQINEKVEVQSLDECCFATSKDLLEKVRFDEACCSHWHLYAVDLCYEARRSYNVKSYVIPELVYHKFDAGTGLTTDKYFLHTLWRLAKKYRKDFNKIYAPCCVTRTNFLSVSYIIAKYSLAPFWYRLILRA